jgi:hypothetical protein
MKFHEFEPKKPKPKHIEVMQERPVYTVQSNADRHAKVQRMMAYKNARSAEQVVPTEVDLVKAFTRYAQTQKVADAAAGNAKSMSDKTIADIQRARR